MEIAQRALLPVVVEQAQLPGKSGTGQVGAVKSDGRPIAGQQGESGKQQEKTSGHLKIF